MDTQDEDIEEKELLRCLQVRDEQAFSRVFLMYYAPLCTFAERYVDSHEAEDAVEEVFFKLLQTGVHFQDVNHLKAYLYRSVKCTCLDTLKLSFRAKERHMTYVTAQNEPEEAYLGHIMQIEARRLLLQTLNTLPPKMARVIQMTYLEGKSNQEAADALGVSLNTVKTQKQRGLNKLRQILPKDQFASLLALAFLTNI